MGKKLIPKFPDWFSPFNRPWLPHKPEEFIIKREYVGSRVQVYDNEKLPIEDDGCFYCLDIENGYDGDPPEVYLCKFIENVSANPHYKGQLKDYNTKLEQFNEWERLNKLWPEYQKQEEARKELAQYKRLKKKFEGK